MNRMCNNSNVDWEAKQNKMLRPIVRALVRQANSVKPKEHEFIDEMGEHERFVGIVSALKHERSLSQERAWQRTAKNM